MFYLILPAFSLKTVVINNAPILNEKMNYENKQENKVLNKKEKRKK